MQGACEVISHQVQLPAHKGGISGMRFVFRALKRYGNGVPVPLRALVIVYHYHILLKLPYSIHASPSVSLCLLLNLHLHDVPGASETWKVSNTPMKIIVSIIITAINIIISIVILKL